MDTELELPEFFTVPILRRLHAFDVNLHFHGCQHDVDGVGDVLNRNTTGTHVGIAQCSDLLDLVFFCDCVKLQEDLIQLVDEFA